MVFEICAIVITILLVVLTVYIVQTLKAVQESLRSSKQVIEKLSHEVIDLREDVHGLLNESKEIIEKVNVRIEDFDPLLESISSLGRTLRGAAHSFEARRVAPEWSEKKKNGWQEGICDVLELTNLGMKVFQQFQKRK